MLARVEIASFLAKTPFLVLFCWVLYVKELVFFGCKYRACSVICKINLSTKMWISGGGELGMVFVGVEGLKDCVSQDQKFAIFLHKIFYT